MICKLYLRKALVKREKGLNEIFKKKKKTKNNLKQNIRANYKEDL